MPKRLAQKKNNIRRSVKTLNPKVSSGPMTVSAVPSAFAVTNRYSAPKQMSKIRVRRREYLGDIISGNNNFQMLIQGDLVPTSTTLFNWLPQLAPLYDEYRFHSLTVDFVTALGTNVPGRVMIYFDPDADDNVPNSKAALLGMPSVSGPVYQILSFNLDEKLLNRGSPEFKYVGAPISTSFKSTGALGIAVDNCGSSVLTLGEIWMEYDISFRVPGTPSLTPGTGPSPVNLTGTEQVIFNSMTVANPFPPSFVATGDGSIVNTNSTTANNTNVAIKAGRWDVFWEIAGTVITAAGLSAGNNSVVNSGNAIINSAGTAALVWVNATLTGDNFVFNEVLSWAIQTGLGWLVGALTASTITKSNLYVFPGASGSITYVNCLKENLVSRRSDDGDYEVVSSRSNQHVESHFDCKTCSLRQP